MCQQIVTDNIFILHKACFLRIRPGIVANLNTEYIVCKKNYVILN